MTDTVPEHERPMSAVFGDFAKAYCEASARARRFETFKTSELERRKKALIAERGPMADAAAEREVKASDDWFQYLEEGVEAVNEAERLKHRLEWLDLKRWEMNDANATRRHEMKHMGLD